MGFHLAVSRTARERQVLVGFGRPVEVAGAELRGAERNRCHPGRQEIVRRDRVLEQRGGADGRDDGIGGERFFLAQPGGTATCRDMSGSFSAVRCPQRSRARAPPGRRRR